MNFIIWLHLSILVSKNNPRCQIIWSRGIQGRPISYTTCQPFASDRQPQNIFGDTTFIGFKVWRTLGTSICFLSKDTNTLAPDVTAPARTGASSGSGVILASFATISSGELG